MPNNYILLETIALTQSAASVTFDNLPTSGYTDLKIVMSARLTSAGYDSTPWNSGNIAFNGTTITSGKLLAGTGSVAVSDNNASAAFTTDTDATANTFGNFEMYVPNYRSSNNKSVSVDLVTENNGTASVCVLEAILSTVTSPITTISFTPTGGYSYAANSTFSLYGIAAFGTTPVTAPKAFGGNSIENTGTHWVHTFTSSGIFTPQVGLTCDYLVVAGGGAGGGSNNAGGGGAGGLRSTVTATGGGGSLETALSVSSGVNYPITIGAGASGRNTAGLAPNGSNSTFSTITSVGGGGGFGGDLNTTSGADGGSGGGNNYARSTNASNGTANQGYSGGVGEGTVSPFRAGGGGGAGETGNSNGLGFGGDGVAVSISGSSVTYAGGGGGGINTGTSATTSGGAGGGGNGANNVSTAAQSGTASLGGGGGGGTNANPTSGNGGSGIVIIRYPIAS
jgi:hypothetical protein